MVQPLQIFVALLMTEFKMQKRTRHNAASSQALAGSGLHPSLESERLKMMLIPMHVDPESSCSGRAFNPIALTCALQATDLKCSESSLVSVSG